MKHKHVEAFRTVMVTLSMTEAAARLHTSQPNISRLIAQLQHDTGLKLFHRAGSRIEPTPEAHALYAEVERSFVGLDQLAEAARSIRRDGTGILRVGVSPLIAMSVLPQAIQSFRVEHPNVAIGVYTSDSATVCKWVAMGACDFGLTNYVVETSALQIRLWHRGLGLCVVPQGHRLARRRIVRAADLAGEPFISLGRGDTARTAVDAAFAPDQRRLLLETPYAATICRLVALGLGVSVVDPLVKRGLLPPTLRTIPFEPDVEFQSYAVQSSRHLQQELSHALMRHLDAMLASDSAVPE